MLPASAQAEAKHVSTLTKPHAAAQADKLTRPSIPAFTNVFQKPALETEWATKTRKLADPHTGELVALPSIRKRFDWHRLSELISKWNRPDVYDIEEADRLTRARIYQESAVDFKTQKGHTAVKVDLGAKIDWDPEGNNLIPPYTPSHTHSLSLSLSRTHTQYIYIYIYNIYIYIYYIYIYYVYIQIIYRQERASVVPAHLHRRSGRQGERHPRRRHTCNDHNPKREKGGSPAVGIPSPPPHALKAASKEYVARRVAARAVARVCCGRGGAGGLHVRSAWIYLLLSCRHAKEDVAV